MPEGEIGAVDELSLGQVIPPSGAEVLQPPTPDQDSDAVELMRV